MTELVSMYLSRMDWFKADVGAHSENAVSIATVLSAERFGEIGKTAQRLDPAHQEVVIRETGKVVDEINRINREQYYRHRDLGPELAKVRGELEVAKREAAEKEAKITKLHKTLKYWKSQARHKEDRQ